MFAKLRSLTMSKLLKLKGFFSDDEYLVLFNRKVCLRFDYKFYSLNDDKFPTTYNQKSKKRVGLVFIVDIMTILHFENCTK